MFRFVSTNATQGLKPVILQNLRNNSGIISQQPATLNNNYNYQRLNYTPPVRSFATKVLNRPEVVDDYIDRLQEDQVVNKAIRADALVKLNYFQEQVHLLNHYRKLHDKDSKRAFSETCHNVLNSFDDKDLRAVFTGQDLRKYAGALNVSIYLNRTTRLTGKKNVDKDQYSSSTSIDEHILKDALLRFHEIILSGELKKIINVDTLIYYFNSMNQFQLFEQSIDVWEQGVNDNEVGELFLNGKVLAVVLDMAYRSKRFSYEEIVRIYELNTKGATTIPPLLLCSMGKIAVSSGDYAKGLDFLEHLLKLYEDPRGNNAIDTYLGDLHLVFIGACKDISISKHFFDKVINFDLPYSVRLKVPYVQSLLENCYESKESLDSILYFWKSTLTHYSKDRKSVEMNSRYSILNNTLFKIFFKVYPELNNESYSKLKEIINSYNNIKSVDEVFINTLISNYQWKDKAVFNQIIENYEIFNIQRTQVSYRVVLKKIGQISGYTNAEIVNKWNEVIQSLDQKNFRYIPVADWASVRDATIWSEFSERKELYWKIVSKYKNYIQDNNNCSRFIKNWLKNDHGLNDLKTKVYKQNSPEIELVPTRVLRPNSDFDGVFESLLEYQSKSRSRN